MFAAALISIWTLLRRWGGIGLFVLGIVDSSLIPTFGSLDAFTAILSVRHKDLWLYYALMSTAGSLIGAYLTYRVGQTGQTGLAKRFRPSRLQQVRSSFAHWGFGAVFVPAVIPPPFPTTLFFVGAGAIRYPLKKYFAAVTLARTLRYGAIAYIGSHFGRHMVRALRHPQQYLGVSIAITLVIVGVVTVLTVAWRILQDEGAAN